jgi:hypothetical protein
MLRSSSLKPGWFFSSTLPHSTAAPSRNTHSDFYSINYCSHCTDISLPNVSGYNSSSSREKRGLSRAWSKRHPLLAPNPPPMRSPWDPHLGKKVDWAERNWCSLNKILDWQCVLELKGTSMLSQVGWDDHAFYTSTLISHWKWAAQGKAILRCAALCTG